MIDAVGNPQSILLLGGTSEIGLAVVEAFASDRPLRVVLAGRPSERLNAARTRLEGRGCAVETVDFDAAALDTHDDVTYYGVDRDISPVAVKPDARRTFIEADLRTWRPSFEFDVVVGFETIEHLETY